MADETKDVKTTLAVIDKSTGPLKQIDKGYSSIKEAAQQAQKAAAQVGTMAPVPGGPAPGAAPVAAPAAAVEAAASPAEGRKKRELPERVRQMREARMGNEELLVAKEEMLARRMRSRGVKMHMQKEQILHRAAETAMMMMIGSENEVAKSLNKYGAATQMIGAQLAGFGGVTGTVGKALANLGGYAAVAGMAFEALSFIDEHTGKNMEHAGSAAYNWAQHLAGVAMTTKDLEEKEALQAKYLGYRSLEEMKAAQSATKKALGDEQMQSQLARQIRLLGLQAKPLEDTVAAQEEWTNSLRKAALRTQELTGAKMEEVMPALLQALGNSAQSARYHALAEATLSKTEEDAIAQLSAMPWRASVEQQQAHIEAVHAHVMMLAKSGKIHEEDAAAVEKNLLAHTTEEGSVQSMIERHAAMATEEARVAELTNHYSRMLPRLHKGIARTAAEQEKYNEVVRQATVAYANMVPNITAEQVKQFQQKLTTSTPHFDFRGSHFDIKQAFAEGFEPGRIAVAFTQDLVQLGERRLNSSLAHPFAGR